MTPEPRTAVAGLLALWDLVVRVWLVIAAWYGLRRPTPLRRLASIGHPWRFVRAAIVPAVRHFALAIAFLPRARRDEATVNFLICKALDAFEDLSADRAAARAGITAAADYLAGRTVRPPLGTELVAHRDPDRLEALLAARLPMLRAALDAQPAPAVERGRQLIDRIAAGMLRASADRRCYADDVLGEAVAFAAGVAAPGETPPRIACRAAGRALQLANDLRDAETERARAIALYQALPELPIVPRLLRWLPATAGAGARATAALIAATTCTFYLRQIPQAAPAASRRLRHPLRTAIAAAWSRRAYLAMIAGIEDALREVLAAVAGLVGPGDADRTTATRDTGRTIATPTRSLGSVGLRDSSSLALDVSVPGASDPIASAATLIALAMELVHSVPEDRLEAAASEPARPARAVGAVAGAATEAAGPMVGEADAMMGAVMGAGPGRAIVLADHLLFAAIDRLSQLGPDSFVHVAALLEELAAPADRAGLAQSTALARFAAATGEGG